MKLHLFLGILLLVLLLPLSGVCAAQEDFTKSVMVNYHISGGNITFVSAEVGYGLCRKLFDRPDPLTGSIIGENNAQIMKFGIKNPQITYLEKGAVVEDEVDFSVLIPYSKNLTALDISDTKTGTKLVHADLSQAKEEFCKSHPEDPDCGGLSLPTTMIIIAAVLIVVCVIVGGIFFLKRKKAA